MKTLVVVLILAAFGLSAAERKITWSPDTAELSWVSSTDGKTKYVVNFRTRLMTANGKQAERFSENEQFRLMQFLMMLESYTLQSEDWHASPSEFERKHEQKQIEKQPRQDIAAVKR
jgi:hypothetical protein